MAFIGDLPTWITALTVVFVAIQFFTDRKRRQEEKYRDERAHASALSVWAVSTPPQDDPQHKRTYGIVVANNSHHSFHNVTINATMHSTAANLVALQILPPGRYFLEYAPKNERGEKREYPWEFARNMDEIDSPLRPFMHTPKYQVNAVRFCDNMGCEWTTNDRAILMKTPGQQLSGL